MQQPGEACEHEADHKADEGLDTSVSVRVVFIGGHGRNGQPEEYEAGCDHVRGRFQAIRNHSGRMPGKSSENLDEGKRTRDQHSGDCDTLPDLH